MQSVSREEIEKLERLRSKEYILAYGSYDYKEALFEAAPALIKMAKENEKLRTELAAAKARIEYLEPFVFQD